MIDRKKLDQARAWARDTEFDPKYVGEPKASAVEIINKLPDEWVDASKVRDVIHKATWQGVVMEHMREQIVDDLEALLPTSPAPRKTLADMDPEERAECQWMQAEDDVGNHVIITELDEENQEAKVLYENGGQFDWSYEILVPLPHLPRMQWPGNEPEETHFDDLPDEVKQVMEESIEDCKAGRFVDFDTPEPAAPHPEDVPAGEPWQIEVDGQEAIGYRNDPDSRLCWTVVRRENTGQHWLYDADVTLIARLVPETTEQENAEQDDESEFDPAYTYSDRRGYEWERLCGRWVFGNTHAERVAAREGSPGRANPPAAYGPYTRIEKENHHDH